MKLKTYISILLLTLTTLFTFAQNEIKFEAKVSKKKLGINERLRIDFVMNQDGDNFNAPSFDGFAVVGGPNQSVSSSWRNGKASYSKSYSYFLAPKKQGKFTIKQATIEIKGQTYKTTPVTITVTKAINKPGGSDNPEYIASENIHLVAEVSNTKPYLNEAIHVVYKLYVSPNTGVSNWREVNNPKYGDFWSQNIDVKGLKVENGKYKGEDYRYVVLRKAVLYPQKTGKLEIEPLTLDITVEVPTKRKDMFGFRYMKPVHQTVSAGSRTIQVKPLPEQGKPLNFSGAVGDFTFKVTTDKSELNATESLQAKVEVNGRGNLKLFELPKLTVPSSLEVYEPEHKENVRTNLVGMQGRTADTYTIVPQYKGKYPVPPISFSYFDLKTESYKTITSDEIIIDVLQGPTNNTEVNTVAKQDVVATNEDPFQFIKTKTNLVPTKTKHFFKTPLFWTSLLTPLLAIPLAMVYRRKRDERNADVVGNRIRKADRLARKYLSEAKQNLGNQEQFYEALERALHNYLKAKLNIETSELSKEKITQLLTERNVEGTTVETFKTILQSCELARYTPSTNVTMQQDYEKASQTISAIDKQMR